MRRMLALVISLVIGLGITPAGANPPLPESGFAGPGPCLQASAIGDGVCVPQTGGIQGGCVRRDHLTGVESNPYGNACTRLKFAYGPILVQPGDNDTGVYVMSIDKPAYDGYMVRLEPNMVTATGEVPDIDDIHLHHATWLSTPSYGNGPWFAAGEEKTIANFPTGFGMLVQRTDAWYAVFMIHNQGTRTEALWVTLTIDYLPRAAAESNFGMKRIRPFWLDVWKNGRRASYPVFNTQRGFGKPITDPVTRDIIRDPVSNQPFSARECTWPRDNCAAHDSWGGIEVGQGAPGNGKGTDHYVASSFTTPTAGNVPGVGTIVGIGGHLHPGGLRVEVDAVRCVGAAPVRPDNAISSWGGVRCPGEEETRRIFTSDAIYFDDEETAAGENLPTSWNMSMTVAGLPFWKVKVEQGWMLRINAVYETDIANWYEGMGIAVAYITPGEVEGAIDPFAATIDSRPARDCWTDPDGAANRLCTRGVVTHGPLPEAENRGGRGHGGTLPWSGEMPTDEIAIGGFVYAPGNLGSGVIPVVKKDRPLTWTNLDAAANIFHTVTTCAYPCNGATGIAYPVADHGWGTKALAPDGNGPTAIDSSELGYSPSFGPARGVVPPEDPDTVRWARDAVRYTITPQDYGLTPGDYTYFCRIHPFMRGAFRVVD